MKITITAKNFKLTQAIKNYIKEKLSKIETYIKNPDVKVVLESRKMGDKIEVTIFEKDILIKSECVNEDLYVAIDLVIDKIKNQLERYTDKKNGFKYDTIRKKENDNMAAKVLEGVIVKRKSFDLKPMFEEEAVLQMELLGHPTFLFFNAEIDAICLLYKRKDGNYGVIETA